jgi:hypothetical protein
MGKSWPLKKAKNNQEARSARSKPKKPVRNRVYINVDMARWLYCNNTSAG